ncbi:EAL domain-containing protein (putative c-di-GMP-specific phosphodiesterase class I) [Azospirillum fermentarium]|uniref:putative bifunctional diguanylate cyclase/phosphodiesterase n=1 Tax=Azospirillum fermentarium TaxID=1233114 RepID=UPI002226496D|nr:EAL domain-containing protein [Azospirillum fermentarium]MCW2246151.1 EAL domain-containing protein (putative c-di-GMP-specific phosphodiesterase class I) [Azospirillum fermentarium]
MGVSLPLVTDRGLADPSLTDPSLTDHGGGFAGRLRAAMANGELSLVFQPQTDTHTGALTGFEALARWRLPDGTAVPPAVFVPMAEETDAIHVLGEWALRRACETAAGWRALGTADVPVAVNLSGRQLDDPGLARLVLQTLAGTGLPADNLKLELTETALFTHEETAHGTIAALRAAGVRLVLDDFGTGYSSLSHLRRLPVETLKIDRHFVQSMVEDRDAAAIVHAVIALAHALGLTVTAEGVETAEQALYLRAFRCDRLQGYHIARPLPAADVPGFVRGLRS